MRTFPIFRAIKIGLVAVGLSCAAPHHAPANDAERILNFHSRILVNRDGRLTVTETIKVLSKGQSIRRGIYRDIPTAYRDKNGRLARHELEFIEVLRDSRKEPHHLERHRGGVRIYIGRADRFLTPGSYTYTLTYRMKGQIGFFKDYDQLYWNVTGNRWGFTIDQASATVALPNGARLFTKRAFTGPPNSHGTDYAIEQDAKGRHRFTVTRPLAPGEGLTIILTWPKGIITPPPSTPEAVDTRRI
jgi:hypothetical protein